MNDLYRNAAPDVSTGFVFDDAILLAALKRIYNREFNPMTELEENLFNEFWKNLNIAAERGLSEIPAVDYRDDFIDALRHNNAVFAAFKTHRAQNDMAARLLDADGELKSFNNWLRDVQPIADHQCRTWFQTEYDTAVKRAHAAAEWKQFEREADVLPNLEWLRTTSITPNAEHAAFWSIPVIRPINDKFWEKHRPQDRWGCKCGLRATDDEPTPDRNMPTPTENDEPSAGLNTNPKDGQLFNNKTHPYSPPGKTCANCAFYNNKPTNLLHKFFNVSFPPKHCEECKNINEVIEKADKNGKAAQKAGAIETKIYRKLSQEDIASIKNSTLDWVEKNLPEVQIDGAKAHRLVIENMSIMSDVIINKTFFTETFAKNIHNKKLEETMKLATQVNDWLPTAGFVTEEEGKHHPYNFKVFETVFNGFNILAKAKVTDGIYLYTMRII